MPTVPLFPHMTSVPDLTKALVAERTQIHTATLQNLVERLRRVEVKCEPAPY